MPLAQVAIADTIVEVAINDSLQYGVLAFQRRNGDTFRSSPVTGAAEPGGAGFSAQPSSTRRYANTQLVVTALQPVSDVKVISSPNLTVTVGATSRLSVGDQIHFVTSSQSSSSDGSVTGTREVKTHDVGIILEVTPKIDIVQEVSLARSENTAAGDNPVVSQRRLESRIMVHSGSTIILGGLIQERSETTKDGVPVIAMVPILGEGFKQTDDTQRRWELLVLITPRVVRNSGQVTDLTAQLGYLMTIRQPMPRGGREGSAFLSGVPIKTLLFNILQSLFTPT